MSNSNQEKIKQAVDLLIDKDTDVTSFFAKDGMLKQYNGLKKVTTLLH